MSFERGKMLE